MEPVTRKEDKLLAALCHISVIFSTMGVILPIVIYVNARERSKPLAFQAMQAMLYHVACLVWVIVFTVVWTVAFIALTGVAVAVVGPEEEPGAWLFAVTIAFVFLLFAGIIVVYILGFAGTVQTMRGRMFRYPVIGGWLEKWLGRDNG